MSHCARILAFLGVVIAGGVPARAIVPLPRPGPPPAPAGWTFQWVPPTYQTITDRAWVPGTLNWVPSWTEVSPGCWLEALRPLQTPGHWTWTTRQVITSPGYWRLIKLETPPASPLYPAPLPLPAPRISPTGPAPSTGVEGYQAGGGEDLSRFSGLSEWPK